MHLRPAAVFATVALVAAVPACGGAPRTVGYAEGGATIRVDEVLGVPRPRQGQHLGALPVLLPLDDHQLSTRPRTRTGDPVLFNVTVN